MGSFGKYGATGFLGEGNTGGTNPDHHDPPPYREEVIQGYWVLEDDLEDYHHYHKNSPQYGHIAPWRSAQIQERKGDKDGDSGGETGATAGGNIPQAIVLGFPGCE